MTVQLLQFHMYPLSQEQKRGESQWHFDQQHKLRDEIKSSGLTHREFGTAEEGCNMIKEVFIKEIGDNECGKVEKMTKSRGFLTT